MTDSTPFPFSAIVGQADMTDALVCNAVHPDIGGVLITGTRGTAKSTAVRSLAHLLPEIEAVADCPYNCPPADPAEQCARCTDRDIDETDVERIRTPFVTLPIGATEDRVLGSIDIESAIQSGETAFEPGLLARANRGILYVDEVNLLGDHLVDVLLDAVASGTNRVEREGVSVEHPANVVLVGTMNPEEGRLRPQLLDRFGLYVEMDRELDPVDRKRVVERRAAYEDDPEGMYATWETEETALADRIREARRLYSTVGVPDELVDLIVELCIEHDVDGLRADIVIHRTARALAALDGVQTVGEQHVTRAAELALGHRSQSASPDDPHRPDSGDRDARDGADGDGEKPPDDELPDLDGPSAGSPADEPSDGDGTTELSGGEDDGEADSASSHVFPIAAGKEPPAPEVDRERTIEGSSTRTGRAHAITDTGRGAYYRARRPRGRPTDIALDATVRAAAPDQGTRAPDGAAAPAIQLRRSDLREKQRRSQVRTLLVFVVDASGSMGAYERMSAVKGAILSILEEAYHDRDSVSLVGFRGDGAETLLPPTASVERAARELAELPTGGRTPLAAGLETARQLVDAERRRRPDLVSQLVLVTDGRPNVAGSGDSPVQSALQAADRIAADDLPAVCIDTETGPVRMELVPDLAERMGAAYYRFDELDATTVSATVSDVFYGSVAAN